MRSSDGTSQASNRSQQALANQLGPDLEAAPHTDPRLVMLRVQLWTAAQTLQREDLAELRDMIAELHEHLQLTSAIDEPGGS